VIRCPKPALYDDPQETTLVYEEELVAIQDDCFLIPIQARKLMNISEIKHLTLVFLLLIIISAALNFTRLTLHTETRIA
jgi:hypothetical protein